MDGERTLGAWQKIGGRRKEVALMVVIAAVIGIC